MKIALITDIHEDYQNLKSALHLIERNGCDEIACLGDISGYSIPYYDHLSQRNAHKCLRLIKENCSIVVVGNHDMCAAQILPKTSPDFNFPDNWYQLDYAERKKLANNAIWLHEENDLNPLYTKEDIEFLQKQPQYVVLNTDNGNILFSHYAYPNISGFKKYFYTYPSEYRSHFAFIQKLGCQLSFTGHSHNKRPLVVSLKSIEVIKNRKKHIKQTPCCISIPPITRYRNTGRFCIFDTNTSELKTIRF